MMMSLSAIILQSDLNNTGFLSSYTIHGQLTIILYAFYSKVLS